MLPRKNHAIRTFVFLALLLGASLAAAQSAGDSGSTGRRVDFPLTRFDDTLFVNVDSAFRAQLDDDGDIWYTTEGGVVHIATDTRTRELFTKFEGLPSSYALGLATQGTKVYVATDLGVGIIDRTTGAVTRVTTRNSELSDTVILDVIPVGTDLWIGTQFAGIAVWDMTRDANDPTAWTFHNTSTTPEYPRAVRRIVPTETAIWVGTEGDGVWRYDLASKKWDVTVKADGLPDGNVLSIAERGTDVWFATARGLAVRNASGVMTVFNRTHGLPNDRVLDVDVIITTTGDQEIFASTSRGLWQLNPETRANVTLAQGYGILGSNIFDNVPDPRGWLFATSRGISYFHDGNWSYYATGPSAGSSWGPASFGFTSASVGDGKGFLWFGSGRGLSAFRPPTAQTAGSWQNFAEWQKYPGSVVNWIDTDGNITWFGTNSGAYGFEHETGFWLPRLSSGSRNLVYGLEADRGELWVALFGDGLLMENLTTGVTRYWSTETSASPLPDQYLTDVRADGDTIWLGASLGIIKMDRRTGLVSATYSTSEGMPGTGVVFRTLPDGPNVWVGTSTGGVARFDVASGKVTRVWNETTSPGFPKGEVRSLYREGARLWVGTDHGLARIDVTTGTFRAWDQAGSNLIQEYVNGITSVEGTLYLATLSGIQRMDIATDTFLPMFDGSGVIRASTSGGFSAADRVAVRIETPRDGGGVAGPTTVRGSALAFGRDVDRVEVKIGDGDWRPATGRESWAYEWDPAGLPVNEPITVAARAFAANATGEAEIIVTPVAPPAVPLTIEEIVPAEPIAMRQLRVGARVEGDEPLTASIFYKTAGSSSFTRLPLSRQGNLFFANVPAREMREGQMQYYLEAQSGLLTASAAGNSEDPAILIVRAPPRLAVAVEGPALLEMNAGNGSAFPLNVTNVGTQIATFRLSATGLRAAWVHLPLEDITLAPGETRVVAPKLTIPATAFSDNTTITFVVKDADGLADEAHTSIPVRILGAPASPTKMTDSAKGSLIPLSPHVALAALAVALLIRRRLG